MGLNGFLADSHIVLLTKQLKVCRKVSYFTGSALMLR